MAIVFILFLPATILFAFYLSAYAAHSFLVVVEETAAGNEEVVWPEELFLDWFWKVFYLAWLLGVCFLPAYLLVRLVTIPFAMVIKPWLSVVVVGGVLWLTFPLSLLSSLNAHSRWIVFRFALLPRLANHFVALLAFYALSGLLLAHWSVLIFLTLFQSGVFLLPVTAILSATALLIYARLLGRLGCLLVNYSPPDQPVQPRWPKPRRAAKRSKAIDPWAVPPGAEGPTESKGPPIILPLDGPIEEYEIAAKPTAPPLPPILGYDRIHDPRPTPVMGPEEKTKPPPIILPLDGPIDGYDVEEKASLPSLPPLLGYDPVSGRPQLAGASAEQRAAEPLPRPAQRLFEERLAEASEGKRVPSPLPPPHMLFHGVFMFPWYRTSLKAWVWLSLGNLLLGVLIQLLVLFGAG